MSTLIQPQFLEPQPTTLLVCSFVNAQLWKQNWWKKRLVQFRLNILVQRFTNLSKAFWIVYFYFYPFFKGLDKILHLLLHCTDVVNNILGLYLCESTLTLKYFEKRGKVDSLLTWTSSSSISYNYRYKVRFSDKSLISFQDHFSFFFFLYLIFSFNLWMEVLQFRIHFSRVTIFGNFCSW